jgi:hypothetical protein
VAEAAGAGRGIGHLAGLGFTQELASLGWTDGRNVRMDLRWLGGLAVLPSSQHTAFAQIAEDRGDMKDRIAIQEHLLYAYAYTYDSKDCVSWANLFTTDAILDLSNPTIGRDGILQWCLAQQKNVPQHDEHCI